MQQLNVSLTIPIPEGSVIISKVELEELKQHQLKGVYWNMKDLERHTGKKHEWLKENILYRQRFRKVLDVENGGFVYYPQSKGQTWVFQASKMAAFLESRFNEIFNQK